MADSGSDLKRKLRARRRAMDSTLVSKSSNIDESQMDDQKMVENISLAEEKDEEGEELKSVLEQRREKSRRLLQQQEQDESKHQPSKLSRVAQVKISKESPNPKNLGPR